MDSLPFPTPAAQRLATLAGARPSADDCGLQLLTDVRPGASGFVAPLADLVVLAVDGPDATTFLQAQLVNDLAGQGEHEVRWNGWCTAKGRLLALFACWRAPSGGWRLLLPAPQVAALQKRFTLFRLRLKCEFTVPDLALAGLAGPAGERVLTDLGVSAPAALRVDRKDDVEVVGLPADAGGARWLVCMPAGTLDAAWPRVAGAAPVASSTDWRATEVSAGVPRLVGAAVEAFVPQTLNLDAVGGIAFDKGCYPGQEVVARSQYLGRLKRRMVLARGAAPAPAAGTDLHAEGATEPVGRVVLAAPHDGGCLLLAELELAHEHDALTLAGGTPLERLPLPYAVPVVESRRPVL